MKKVLISAAAAAVLLGAAACSQGPNEEAGEAADTSYEQSTTGTTDVGQGPQEEAGEQIDETTGDTPASNEAAPPPATTP